ncbi:MAG: methionyl-tRNA formyltransferase [Rhodospirillaceae bacterium]|jgi:methionyl-tRNA formyltransferase|nr:methionyl-tRNA formyltransferase [Rhodospirillaceae bacterium]
MGAERLRLVFMGSPDFSVPALAALIEAGHEIACVYSQPPRPAGRGHKERPGPVQAFADAQGIPVRTPVSLKDDTVQAAFADLQADAAVVVAYGLILPKPILDAPRLGCINIHASLLPRWRGAAPIQRAIEAGDEHSGVCIMAMDAGLDTGGVYLRGEVEITSDTTASDLHDQLAAMGGKLIVDALPAIAAETLAAEPQPEAGVTYAHKLARDEGRLDWSRPAVELERQVRALNPWPGVWCEHDGQRLKVLGSTLEKGEGPPGTVIAAPLVVACGEGALRVTRAQRAGKSAMDIEPLVRGNPVPIGTIFS